MNTRNKLSALSVKRETKPGFYGDGAGLYLQVSDYDTKSWILRFQIRGKRRDMGLGSVLDVSLAEARKLAAEYRAMAREHIDPIVERERQRVANWQQDAMQKTFAEVTEEYIGIHRVGWKTPRHETGFRQMMTDHASPINSKLVSMLTAGDIAACLSPIWIGKHQTAMKLRRRIESVLELAKTTGYRSGDNPARFKGNLEHILAKVKSETRHQPALPYEEIPPFFQSLPNQHGVAEMALRFTILTAARTKETLKATWAEVDLDARTWTRPADHMKGKKEHTVPLSQAAVDVLNEAMAICQNEFLFPGNRGSLGKSAMYDLVRRMGRKDITVHGFRSSFRDWVSECTSTPTAVAEMSLAHTIKSGVERAYRRGELLEKRRVLMEAWGRYCLSKPGKVIELGGHKQANRS